jgi:hypothetical protein
MDIKIENKNNLRSIKTIYCVDELNEYILAGRIIILRDIEKNESLISNRMLLRSYKDGTLEEVPSREFHAQYVRFMSFPEKDWELIKEYEVYFRERNITNDDGDDVEGTCRPWAAYVLPEKVEIGERLYIEDIIEDILIEEFWDIKIAATDGECIWDGGEIQIDLELYDKQTMIG